jgi:hypothetical protein
LITPANGLLNRAPGTLRCSRSCQHPRREPVESPRLCSAVVLGTATLRSEHRLVVLRGEICGGALPHGIFEYIRCTRKLPITVTIVVKFRSSGERDGVLRHRQEPREIVLSGLAADLNYIDAAHEVHCAFIVTGSDQRLKAGEEGEGSCSRRQPKLLLRGSRLGGLAFARQARDGYPDHDEYGKKAHAAVPNGWSSAAGPAATPRPNTRHCSWAAGCEYATGGPSAEAPG